VKISTGWSLDAPVIQFTISEYADKLLGRLTLTIVPISEQMASPNFPYSAPSNTNPHIDRPMHAQSRSPIDMIFHGWAMRVFQA